jgi:sortase (surface protein transpeptidase)
MPRPRKVSDSPSDEEEFVSQLTGTSPEAIENEMINLAVREVEYRIRNHKASSQELVHYLRMSSEKERLEREKLEAEVELQRVKAAAIESGKHMEELYADAINAMKLYSGVTEEE